MKLAYYQLEQHLSKNLKTVYIISGDEILLKQDATRLIRQKAKAEGFTERLRYTPDGNWEQVYTLLYGQSLLAEKRILEFDFTTALPNKVAIPVLKEYARQTNPDTLVIINTARADAKLSKAAWYQAMSDAGVVIAIWPISRDQLPKWLLQRAKAYRLMLTSEAANLLADYVEGNLLAASQALEKLYLLQPQSRIDADLIRIAFADTSHYSLFDLTDAFVARDKNRMLHILDNLKQEGVEPVLILWALTREIRQLIEMSQELRNGTSFENVFRKHRIYGNRQQPIRQFLATYNDEQCSQIISHASIIDQTIKGASLGNVWHALQLFCLRL